MLSCGCGVSGSVELGCIDVTGIKDIGLSSADVAGGLRR